MKKKKFCIYFLLQYVSFIVRKIKFMWKKKYINPLIFIWGFLWVSFENTTVQKQIWSTVSNYHAKFKVSRPFSNTKRHFQSVFLLPHSLGASGKYSISSNRNCYYQFAIIIFEIGSVIQEITPTNTQILPLCNICSDINYNCIQ